MPTLFTKEVDLGPDRVAPVNKVIGFDGSRTHTWMLVAGPPDEFVETIPNFFWQIIQAPQGDAHLALWKNVEVPYNTVVIVGAPFELITVVAGSTLATLNVGFAVPDLVAGCLLVINSGPNAGSYKISTVDEIVGGYELGTDPSTPFLADELNITDWTIYGPLSTLALVPDLTVSDASEDDAFIMNGTAVTVRSVTEIPGNPTEVVVEPGLPAGTTAAVVSIIRASILSNAKTPYPSFVPTVQGVYVIRAYVDGTPSPKGLPALDLPAGVVAISATATESALGLPVDASWIWRYLSDFWGRVTDRQWGEGMWRTAIRAAASILQETWNVEMAMSLANAGDVAISRWLDYEVELREPNPTTVILHRRSRVVYSNVIDITSHVALSVTLTVHNADTPTVIAVTDVPVNLSDSLDYELTQAGITSVKVRTELMTDPGGGPDTFHLTVRSDRYVVEVDGDPYSAAQSTNWENNAGKWLDESRLMLSGLGTTAATYSLGRYDVDGALKAGDPLNVEGKCYTIKSVGVLNEHGGLPILPITYVALSEPLALAPTTPQLWAIPSFLRSPDIDYEYELVTPGDPAIFTSNIGDQQHEVEMVVITATAYRLGVMDPSLWHDNADYVFTRILRFFYTPVPDEVLSIPVLKIYPEDTKGWLEYADFVVADRGGRRAIVFDFLNEPGLLPPPAPPPAPSLTRTRPAWTPPDRIWAEVSYIDQRPTLDLRYGDNLGLRLEEAPERASFSYSKALLGLWYCYLYGSKPANLEKGVSIIMGAPFFEVDGIVVDSRILDAERGYLLVRDLEEAEIVRTYIYPLSLGLGINPETDERYKVGDTVSQFEPVSDAAIYRDYINDPVYIKALVAAGVFTEPEKMHTFSLGVDSYFFQGAKSETIQAAADFLDHFRTTYNRPLFAIIKQLVTEIEIEDDMLLKAILHLISYPGQRWGTPIYDRVQLSGSGVHSYHDFNLDAREHFVAERWYDGGTMEHRVRFYHRPVDWPTVPATEVLDPELWGMAVGDLLICPDQPGTGYVERAITQVKPDPDNYIVVNNPGWQWSDWVDSFAVSENPADVRQTKNWCGFDDIRFYPRSHVYIKCGADIRVVADYPGPEQLK